MPSIFRSKEFILFVAVLGIFNAALIFLYFSGSPTLQQIAAPSIEGLIPSQGSEFGLIETLQNILLLGVIIVLIVGAIKSSFILDRFLYVLALAVFTFLFLEEVDYGLHYYEFLTGGTTGVETRNWHNQWNEGLENATRLKRLSDAVNAIWFVLIPLLARWKPIGNAVSRINIVPTIWFAAGFVLALVLSKFAHYLDDQGYSVINGVPGNIDGKIAEFRETSIYYLYLLYALQLIKTPKLFGRNPE